MDSNHNPNHYRWCSVPQCKNTSLKTPNKLFICVPRKKNVRKTWLKLARQDPEAISTAITNNSNLYFCEDHFDLPNDMISYVQYKVMGSVSQIRMKSGCIPTRFECQGRKKQTDTTERPYVLKKRRKEIIEEIEKYSMEQTTPIDRSEIAGTSQSSDLQLENKSTTEETGMDKSHDGSSKSSETDFKVYPISHSKPNPPSNLTTTEKRNITTKTSNINPPIKSFLSKEQGRKISYLPNQQVQSGIKLTTAKNMLKKTDKKQLIKDIKIFTQITKNPLLYIGILEKSSFLINLLEQISRIPANHILMCLKKIRLNNTFTELADEFALAPENANKTFFKSIPLLASVMQNFIVPLEYFRNVTCIIDLFEIEMEETLKASNQDLTWSEQKKANTVKYLVSCNPSGLVNYVSQGHGGRISDTYLVQCCDFTKYLRPCMRVMVNRDFKHLEEDFQKHSVQLIHSSVTDEAKGSREIHYYATLKTKIENVISNLQQFNMLKPNACLDRKLVSILDDIVTIACGLINFQDGG